MLRIRLSRVGKKKQPTYRLTVSEKIKDTYGNSLEILGNYDARRKAVNLNEDRIKYWLSKGAQASSTVHNLLVEHGIVDGPKVKVSSLKKKKEEKKEEKAEGETRAEEKAKEGEEKEPEQKEENKENTETETKEEKNKEAEGDGKEASTEENK